MLISVHPNGFSLSCIECGVFLTECEKSVCIRTKLMALYSAHTCIHSSPNFMNAVLSTFAWLLRAFTNVYSYIAVFVGENKKPTEGERQKNRNENGVGFCLFGGDSVTKVARQD